MAILSRKSNTEEAEALATPTVALDATASKNSRGIVVPRLSEKAGAAEKLNKYIFTVFGKMNKVEVKKAVEQQYGVKIAQVNMVAIQGKSLRRGIRMGRTSDYKKAIVTLTKDSKKITLVEPN